MPRSAHESTEPLSEKIRRKSARLAKVGRRWLLNLKQGRRPETRVVFIMGAQRSGTRVPLVALERAPDILTFREGAKPFFSNGRLRPDDALEELFDACWFPTLVIKPLMESHRALDLLSRFPASRVIWIFRRPEDVIRSASLKWNSGAQVITQLMEGGLRDDDWRLGGVTADALAAARAMYRQGLSAPHANAILWYLRTRLILDLDLAALDRVLLVSFEDLTQAPRRHFPRVFSFVGHPMQSVYLDGIHARPAGSRLVEGVPEDVMAVCHALHADVERRYREAVDVPSGPAA